MRRLLVLLLLLPFPQAQAPAQADPGSGFASMSLTAIGAGQSFLFTASDQVPAALSIPYAAAEIRLGSGVATSSVAWPGEVGASLGSALVVLGAPPEAAVLNHPFVARARTGSGPADVRNDSLPGSSMAAHATAADVHAETSTHVEQSVAATAGATTSSARVALTGATQAIGTASSTLRDVTVAGVVHVGSVTSTARGTTDGLRADASGSTVVTDLTVAGIPITVDERGVTVAGNAVPAGGALDAVNAALQQAQVSLTVSRPVKVVKAGAVEYAAGSLLLGTPLGVLSLGGVSLRLAATRDDPLAPVVDSPDVPPLVLAPPAPVDAGPVFTTSPPSGPGPSVLPGPVRTVVEALVPVSLRTGYGPWWVLSGLLLAVGLGAVARRVPALVLPPPPAPCPWEDPP